jgi:hypothetical protein
VPAHTLESPPFTGGAAPREGWWQRIWKAPWRRARRRDAGPLSLRLGAGQELRLHDADGWTVACRGGSVWITQEADSRDVFLGSGGRFTLDRLGLALILARRDSSLTILPPFGGRGRAPDRRLAHPVPAPDRAREVWLKAVYPECGPWNDPAAYRRSGLL